jgi:predicted DNA-binding ribbon-helix-helix protein
MRAMKSSIVKRTIIIDGHNTSVSLEDAFWNGLKKIAHARRVSVPKIVAEINEARQHRNLSSAIRLFVLDQALTHGKRRRVKK